MLKVDEEPTYVDVLPLGLGGHGSGAPHEVGAPSESTQRVHASGWNTLYRSQVTLVTNSVGDRGSRHSRRSSSGPGGSTSGPTGWSSRTHSDREVRRRARPPAGGACGRSAEPEGAVVVQTGPGVPLRGDGDPAPVPRLPRQRPGVPTRSRNGHVAGSCGGSGVVTSCGPAWAGKSPLGSAHNAVRSADGPIRRCPTCARRRSGVGTPRRRGR